MAHYAGIFTIDRLRVDAHLGFYDDERMQAQPVEISLRIYFQTPPAATRDDFGAFIDYAAIARLVCDAIAKRQYRMIEFMAQQLFDGVRAYLDRHGGTSHALWLRLTKCQPQVEYLQNGASYVVCDLPADATMVEAV